jgi:hypothetical protein
MNFTASRSFIDLLDKDAINKLKDCNYKSLEIKRKRRPVNPKGTSAQFNDVALEIDYPVPWIMMIEDIIEIYGVNANNKYLIYKTEWSKDYAKKLRMIVD